jgi:chromosomal replication initiator protein
MTKEKEGGQENDNENHGDQNNSQTWNLVREKLSEYISGDAFSRWFKNAELVDPEQQDGLVAVQSDMHQIWIETNYMDELRAAFAEGAGIHCSPQIVVKGDVEADLPEVVVGKIPLQQENQKIAVRGARANSSVKVVTPNLEEKTQAFQRKLKRLGINPDFDFESFVVGDNSQFAHAACSAVAHQEGRSFNPLFIHGRAGLGKTHLMSAVAQQLLANDPKAKVVFLTAEHFANEFIEAVRKGN